MFNLNENLINKIFGFLSSNNLIIIKKNLIDLTFLTYFLYCYIFFENKILFIKFIKRIIYLYSCYVISLLLIYI